MRTIISGSRNIVDYQFVKSCVEKADVHITEVVSGTARGVDKLGEKYAVEHNIPIKKFPADWDLYGKSAGYIRNEQMAKYADVLIAIWDGDSKGTHNMVRLAHDHSLIVKLFLHKKEG
jgi:hypothetical protein